MQTLRRRGLKMMRKAALLVLAVSAAFWVRQTQASLFFEIYNWLSLPFQPSPVQQEILVNARIKELEIKLQELEQQNKSLTQLLNYTKTKNVKGVVAPVIGRSADYWWKKVTLGRGSKDGIQEGFIVMGTGGLVGRIISVTPNTSQVLLVSDPTSKVGVGIIRSRQMGFMKGQDDDTAVMEFFDDVPDIKVGDSVSTSAYSQLFPAGWPVGTVESINLTNTPAPEAIVKLSAPLNILEWVNVYPNKQNKPES
ncbi:rod shape-determining protein MreC [Hydrocoleum sp. CS-953]|uniref:rod shape-determining protein MreC n=1 Tax=Microcoleaceae TaxID=1892252 RepID=UPI000B9B87E9|nr:rod shape-determining protein MreC [Hydrocoleum sp. CS-953]OZH55557.1 rod shape-determining protein MreC [Hydrocoleum sp. CS-953]